MISLWSSGRIGRTQLVALGIFSLLFALSWTLPSVVDGAGLFTCVGEGVLFAVPLFFVFAALLYAISAVRERSSEDVCTEDPMQWESGAKVNDARGKLRYGLKRHRVFLLVFLMTMAVWGVVFLICYPGIASKDTMDIIRMALGEESPYNSSFKYDGLNEHHPLLNTGLVWLILKVTQTLGASMTTSVACLSVCHMVFLALSCAFCTSTIHVLTRSKAVVVFCVLFLTFNPLTALYSITIWKDVLFAAALLALATLSVKVMVLPSLYQKRPYRLIPFGLLLVACALLRSNGLVAAIVIAAGVLIVVRGLEYRKLLGWATAGAFMLLVLMKGPVCWLLGVQPAHFAEAIAVPIQQIGRTVVEDGPLTDEQQRYLEGVIPLDAIKESYDPWSPNAIKFHEEFNDDALETDKGAFLKTWAEIGANNPGSYVRAWCAQTECFWSMHGSTWYFSTVGFDLDGDGVKDEEPLLSGPVAPYNLFEIAGVYMSIFSFLFQPAALGWFVLFALLCFWMFGDKASAVIALALTAYWLTLLVAAPATDFRYIFPVMMCVPLIMVLLVCSGPSKRLS